MQPLMDRLFAALTECDRVIARQRRALATVDALSNMNDLQTARKHIRAAQTALATIEGDALPALASSTTTQTTGFPSASSRLL